MLRAWEPLRCPLRGAALVSRTRQSTLPASSALCRCAPAGPPCPCRWTSAVPRRAMGAARASFLWRWVVTPTSVSTLSGPGTQRSRRVWEPHMALCSSELFSLCGPGRMLPQRVNDKVSLEANGSPHCLCYKVRGARRGAAACMPVTDFQ
jgi:hypothetical protein